MFWRRLVYRLMNAHRVRLHRREWDKVWSDGKFSGAWAEDRPREQVIRAAESRRWPAGATVLDIGCGDGASAAWLARNGYRVTGIDLSPEAVRRAQARYAGLERLEFAAVDCCEPGVVPRTFDVLLDCGCLHCIPPRHVPRYVANLARWAAPGAELMILAFTRELTFERRVEITGTLLQADFEMRSAEPTVMLSPGSEQTNPAAEMHFVRRSTPV